MAKISGEVVGVSLESLRDPIQHALNVYGQSTDGQIGFDIEAATQLELTPDKSNSARSSSAVTHLGEEAGKLTVIVFAPEDGTGDFNTFRPGTVGRGMYAVKPGIYPRSKATIDTEAHLTIASKKVETSNTPVLFAGHLQMLGVGKDPVVLDAEGDVIQQIGYVGQALHRFSARMREGIHPEPTVTLTTGYKGGLDEQMHLSERFGDPHAIYNGEPDVLQVCAFIGISTDLAARHRSALESLRAVEPQIGKLA